MICDTQNRTEIGQLGLSEHSRHDRTVIWTGVVAVEVERRDHIDFLWQAHDEWGNINYRLILWYQLIVTGAI